MTTTALAQLRARAPSARPRIAVVLGSGWSGLTTHVQDAQRIPYAELNGFPKAGVLGHAGELWLGRIGAHEVAVMSGRKHAYESGDVNGMQLPLQTLRAFGCEVLVQTNAAGSLHARMPPGSLMVLTDHINLMGNNPLVGPNDERFGVRFPDMTEVYSRRLRTVTDQAGAALGVTLPHGVYAGLLGPSYETPAEIRYLRTIGADAVGMSTVPEAIVARHMGMEVLGVSCITNMAAGVLPAPLDHSEVMETARRVRGQFIGLLQEVVARA